MNGYRVKPSPPRWREQKSSFPAARLPNPVTTTEPSAAAAVGTRRHEERKMPTMKKLLLGLLVTAPFAFATQVSALPGGIQDTRILNSAVTSDVLEIKGGRGH